MVSGKIRRGSVSRNEKGRNKNLLNIAVVIDSIAVKAGIERVVTGLSNLWSDLGYSVTFVTRDARPSAFPLNKKVKQDSLGMASGFSPLRFVRYVQMFTRIIIAAKCLRKYFSQNKFDYIYSASPDNTFALYLAGLFRTNKILASEHGAYSAYNIFWKTMKRFVYPKVFSVIAITATDAARYKKMNQNSLCMPNPLSFTSDKVSKLSSKTALAVGRLVRDKGYDRMIEIWAQAAEKYPGWKLRIVGDGPMKEQLKNLVREKNLEGKISIERAKADIRNEYLGASLYLMTSYGEGFGMVLIEAMECGLPCIAFDCPVGPGEIIRGGNGLLIPDGDNGAYVTAVKKLIEDRALRGKISAKGKLSVQRYSPGKIAALWRLFYEK